MTYIDGLPVVQFYIHYSLSVVIMLFMVLMMVKIALKLIGVG